MYMVCSNCLKTFKMISLNNMKSSTTKDIYLQMDM